MRVSRLGTLLTMEKLFGIPIFEDEVDLEKIILPDAELEKTWDSGTPTTFGTQTVDDVPQETWKYLSQVVENNLYPAQLMVQILDLVIYGRMYMVNMIIRMFTYILIVSGVL